MLMWSCRGAEVSRLQLIVWCWGVAVMAVEEEAGRSRIRWDCRRFGFYFECDGGRISTATVLEAYRRQAS